MADVFLFQFLQLRGARVAGEPTPAYGVFPRTDAGCPDSARLPILGHRVAVEAQDVNVAVDEIANIEKAPRRG